MGGDYWISDTADLLRDSSDYRLHIDLVKESVALKEG
jgi:hypothetical protein